MIFLNIGLFKPSCILTSVVILPITIASWVLVFANFKIGLFVVSLLMLLCYFAIVFWLYKYSKTEKYYLFEEDNVLIINYPKVDGKCYSQINVCSILKMEYYKISSAKSWCMLYNYVSPQCVYITYVVDGKEVCQHIGYPEFNKISKLCTDIGVPLLVK